MGGVPEMGGAACLRERPAAHVSWAGMAGGRASRGFRERADPGRPRRSPAPQGRGPPSTPWKPRSEIFASPIRGTSFSPKRKRPLRLGRRRSQALPRRSTREEGGRSGSGRRRHRGTRRPSSPQDRDGRGRDASGAASFSASLSGEASSPAVRGSIRGAEDPPPQVDPPADLALGGEIHFAPGRVLIEGVKGEVGGGTVAVDGSVSLAGLKPASFAVVARARGLRSARGARRRSSRTPISSWEWAAARPLLSGESGFFPGVIGNGSTGRRSWLNSGGGRTVRGRKRDGWKSRAGCPHRGKRESLDRQQRSARAGRGRPGAGGTAARPGFVGRVEAREGTILFDRGSSGL